MNGGRGERSRSVCLPRVPELGDEQQAGLQAWVALVHRADPGIGAARLGRVRPDPRDVGAGADRLRLGAVPQIVRMPAGRGGVAEHRKRPGLRTRQCQGGGGRSSDGGLQHARGGGGETEGE